MSGYRFYNARLLTMEGKPEVSWGELWTENDRITYVGPAENAPDKTGHDFTEEIDAKGFLIMPGFKDAHTHSAMVFLRSLADDLPLHEWLNNRVFPCEAKLDPDMIYHLTKLAVLEYLTSGITSVFEMYLTPMSIADAFEETGMRCVQTGSLNNFSQSLELLEEWYQKLNSRSSLMSFVPGFHAEYTCSRELLEGVAALAKKYRTPVWCHNSETESEVEQCRERYGMTPTRLFDELGIYDFGGGGYHCVYFDDEDVEIFAKKGLSIVTNPASNAKLASGIAPLSRYLKAGINIAIGTDGPASNNCLDMFREMFLVAGLAKLKEKDAAAMDAAEVLKMATVGGAKAMGLKECDCLSPGKKADLIMLDMDQPNMRPINNIVKNIVYSGSKQNVSLTMIDGVIRYRKGEFFVGEDAEKIIAKAEEITGSLI